MTICFHRPLAALSRIALSVLCAALLVLATPGLVSIGASASAHVADDLDLLGGGIVQPFFLAAETELERDHAVGCLAQAVYFEAGFEPIAGQRAVAQVVLNRVRDPNFPASICGVVYQGWERKTGCQFSFVCDGSLTRRPPTMEQWAAAWDVAVAAVTGYVEASVGTATHYHTDYVDPYWAPTLVEVSKVGQHIFYKWPGKAGTAAALQDRYRGESNLPHKALNTLNPYLG